MKRGAVEVVNQRDWPLHQDQEQEAREKLQCVGTSSRNYNCQTCLLSRKSSVVWRRGGVDNILRGGSWCTIGSLVRSTRYAKVLLTGHLLLLPSGKGCGYSYEHNVRT